jgi:hypothetical protein
MKTITNKIVLIGLLVLLVRVGNSQGFVNLDFESANLTGYSPGNVIPAANAFPGWTVSAGYIVYDDFSLSGGSISIFDSRPPSYLPPIQGTYFAYVASANNPQNLYSISLGQTGTIPQSAESISFWGNDEGMQITFKGRPLDFLVTGNTANYNIYSADISAFAGQTGQLLFTAPPGTGSDMLDNIQLSPSPAPEPSSLGLFALGGLIVAWFHSRKSSPKVSPDEH